MTEPTNRQKTIAQTLLDLQDAYSTTLRGDLSEYEKLATRDEIAGYYATALISFLETKN